VLKQFSRESGFSAGGIALEGQGFSLNTCYSLMRPFEHAVEELARRSSIVRRALQR